MFLFKKQNNRLGIQKKTKKKTHLKIHWLTFGHFKTDIAKTQYDDEYPSPYFHTSVNDHYLHSRSQLYESSKTSALVLSNFTVSVDKI